MIPTYNRSKYLEQTLESVLCQGFDADAIQIEVVDNCSTQNEPEAIVRAIAPERVSFYRQPKHVSMTANWNTCIQRARGYLVHILHDDDYVLPGFYEAFGHAFNTNPNVALVASRCFYVDAEGEIEFLSQRIPAWERPSNDLTPLYVENPLCAPAVVFRRTFYEEFGGFLDLCYVPDWEMWVRALRLRGGLFLNRPLAAYRSHPQNQTSVLMQTADDLRDELWMADLWERQGHMQAAANLRQIVAYRALVQADNFRDIGNRSATNASLNFLDEVMKYLPLRTRLTLLARVGMQAWRVARARLKLRTRLRDVIARLAPQH